LALKERDGMTRIKIQTPDDWHLHFRDGDMLNETVPATARCFNRAIVMPNLVPPVTNAKMVEDGFHARFNTKKRAYKYKILNRNAPPAILYNRVWHIKTPLDIDNMQQCGNILLGTHDFSSFRAAECQAQTPIKTLDKIKVSVESDIISIYVEAKSFLHHMVRNIVGTLYLAGSKKITPTDMQKILLAKDRSRAGQTAPACGLYFYKVWY